jgi:predicted short-subunit dehydrogenase-like oxidoreductase (DUF2520 family)
MTNIVVLGTGNVAFHFIQAFEKAENFEVVQIYNHNSKSLETFQNYNTTIDFSGLKKADLYLICVKDDKVAEVATAIPYHESSIVAHVSGSVPLLDTKHKDAVFYPLQTFSKDKIVSFENLPLCVEAENDADFLILKQIGEALNAKVYKVNSIQRQELHLAAVFVCNFVNHLYHVGHEICEEKQLPFDILKPLIIETADKILSKPPKEVQTGPAKRHDQSTIERHIEQLKASPYKDLYRYLTSSIQNTHE